MSGGARHESGRAACSELDFGRYAPCANSEHAKINRATSSKGEVHSKSAQFSSDIDNVLVMLAGNQTGVWSAAPRGASERDGSRPFCHHPSSGRR